MSAAIDYAVIPLAAPDTSSAMPAAGNTPTSGGNRAGGSSFLYTYGGTIPPAAYIHAITAATNSAVPDVEAFSNDIANDGSWTVMYGPTFSGALAVTARTGAGNVGDALAAPASALVFPAMLDAAAAQIVAVPTENNGQNYVYEAEHTYTFAPGASVDGQTYFVDVTPTGATTQRAIHFVLEDSAPVIGNLAPTSDGVVVIDGAGKIHVGPNTSTLSISFTATEPDAGNGRSRLARVTCPAAFGSAAQDLTISGAGYTCVYPMTARTPGEHNLSIQAADNFANVGAQAFSVVYDASAPEVTLDVPDHPGLTYFVAWTVKDDVAVESFDARLVDAVDSDLDGDVDAADNNCAAEGVGIEVDGKENRLELANTGKGFCLRARDALGNQSAWAWSLPGFKTVATLTYGFGGVSVVERAGEVASDNETVYVVGDHLGSASLALKPEGAAAASVRYLPFGEERWEEVDLPSDRGFTGQRAEKGFGLMDFKARFYSPHLLLFISPDSLVPDPYNALDWNRYLYVRANPINFNDPSGHAQQCPFDDSNCAGAPPPKPTKVSTEELSKDSGTETGVGGYQMYLLYRRLFYTGDGWWWKFFGKDGNFSLRDFFALFFYFEGAKQINDPDRSLYPKKLDVDFIEGGVRGLYGWCEDDKGSKYCGPGGADSLSGKLNFMGAASQSMPMRYFTVFTSNNNGSDVYTQFIGWYDLGGSFIEPVLADTMATTFFNPPLDWKGWAVDRPYEWGNVDLTDPAVLEFLSHSEYVFNKFQNFIIPTGLGNNNLPKRRKQ